MTVLSSSNSHPSQQASQTEISLPDTKTSVPSQRDSELCVVQESDVSRLVRGRSDGKHDEVCEHAIIVIELIFPESPPTITNGVRSEFEITRLPPIRTQESQIVAIDEPDDPHSNVSSDIQIVEFEIRKS
ncbi:hypothetical protein BLNAU_18241 [Blattamonas nauphoetae]|uniref:Uncharacterized protein n=1 Tax=Blattamonas nauphoetae TaxID=2049346 RepID=A0ABQ9X515_9EUKA|nr:hypothetical protein BLNAU_18241 [Blattamonas nauphoetae]